MTRTSSTLVLTVALLGAAIAAVPAAASDGYQTANAITGGGGGPAQAQPNDYASLNAAVGPDAHGRSPVSFAEGDPSSLNAVLAMAAEGPASSGPDGGYRSLTAIVGPDGPPQPSATPVADAGDGDGFDWLDALIGAVMASGLLLMTLAAARTVARHRRATAESRA